MKQYTTSTLTGREYCPEDCVRILNIRQVIFYMHKGIPIQDMFPSRDYKTGDEVMVFIVSKEESREAYDEWLKTYYQNRIK